jgi:ribonucleoside-diphosphate reductase alpha chain
MFLSPLSEFVYYRTYSRFVPELNRRETYQETVARFLNYLQAKRPGLPSKMWKAVERGLLEFNVFPAMRLLWAAGAPMDHNNLAGFNCSFMRIDSPACFGELLYLLMNGAGGGFSLESIGSLPVVPVRPRVGASVTTHVVEDSKEGWKASVDVLVDALYAGKLVEMDYSNVRKKGTPLKTFGGRASGPEPLHQVHQFLKEIFHKAQGRKLSSTEVHDVCCEIAQCVVVGGVRRSSLISLAALEDEDHASLKTGVFPLRRYMANNTAIYDKKPDAVTFMREWLNLAASGSGERGIFNRQAAQAMAPARRDADKIVGGNPCFEAMLRDKGLCNLSSVVVRETDTLEDLVQKVETATWLATIQASFTDYPNMSEGWKKNAEEEALILVSLAGQMDHPAVLDATTLKHLKNTVIRVNKKAAKALGIRPAAATTGVKPEGTLSLVANCGAGLHPYWSPYYVRRVRINAEDPLCKVLRCYPDIPLKPEVGQDKDYPSTWVGEFPCKAPSTAVFRKDMTAIQQLEWYLHLMDNYVEQNASATIYVKPEEWLKVGAFVYENFDRIVGVSFLPDDGGVYELAPLEEISKEEYEARMKTFPMIDYSLLSLYEKGDETEGAKTYACSGGGCSL